MQGTQFVYICSSPVLCGHKIGYHNGNVSALFKRYQTSLTNMVNFVLFPSTTPEHAEVIIHRILAPYKISNEVFCAEHESQNLHIYYCYIAKAVTGCAEVLLYSREKYGLVRQCDRWRFQKMEMDEQEQLNTKLISMTSPYNVYNQYVPQKKIPTKPHLSQLELIQKQSAQLWESLSAGKSNFINWGAPLSTTDIFQPPNNEDDIEKAELENAELEKALAEVTLEDQYDQNSESESNNYDYEVTENMYPGNPFAQWAYRGPKNHLNSLWKRNICFSMG